MTSSSSSQSPGRDHVRVTHYYRNGQPEVACVHRNEVGKLDNKPRRRRVSIAWDDVPRLVLIAATPHSARALAALPKLIALLQTMPGVTLAVTEEIAKHCDTDVPIVKRPHHSFVRRPSAGSDNKRFPISVDTMSQLKLTDSAAVTAQVDARPVIEACDVDLVMCLGGDGLILHVISHLFPAAVPPVMPFNMGSMGFLTPFDFSTYKEDTEAVLNGQNNSVTMRMRLKCVIERQPASSDATKSPCIYNFEDNMLNDETVECSVTEEHHVLNELVIDRGPAPYLSNLEVLCDDCPVTRVQADGLIVATPTGSTAYSLSSGGSMVHPNVPAILFTPICPHSLSFRPVLFPDYVTLQIKVPEDSRASAWVSFDGRHRMELKKGDKVVVSVSEWSVPTFSRKDTTNDWFTSVSQCLRWNERVVQGSMDTDTH